MKVTLGPERDGDHISPLVSHGQASHVVWLTCGTGKPCATRSANNCHHSVIGIAYGGIQASGSSGLQLRRL